MAATIGSPSLRGYPFPDFMFTFNLASGITIDDIGAAVTLDTSGSNKVKLAGAGDKIFGRLHTVEKRAQEGILVGTVQVLGSMTFEIASGETVDVGDTLIGAGDGAVKAATTADPTDNLVVEVNDDLVTIFKR